MNLLVTLSISTDQRLGKFLLVTGHFSCYRIAI